MSNEIRIKAVLDDKVSSGLDKIKDKLDKVGGKGTASTAFGVVAAKGLGLIARGAKDAGEAIGSYIHDSIGLASDLNETVSKTKVVFGDASKGVEEWGTTAARSMGLSENAALGAAASIGNLLLSTGTAPAKIAPMSEAIVQLASDLASFNNIPVEDALAKLQSGLVGQERPLRELGVAISAASVDTEALALGFQKVNGEFTEGQKVQARYSLIFKQTGTAQGDFSRTSDQLANSQRILNAEWEDEQAKIGQKLLPLVLSLTRGFIDLFSAIDGGTRDNVQGLEQQTADMLTLNAGLNDWTKHLEILKQAQIDLHNSIHTDSEIQSVERSIAATEDAIQHVQLLGKATDDTALTAARAGNLVSRSFDGIGKSAHDAKIDVRDAMSSIVRNIQGARKNLIDGAQGFADSVFDPLIAKAQLTATKLDIIETNRLINSGKLKGKDLADAKLNLLELEKTATEQEAALAGYGDKSAAAALKHQIAVLKSTKHLTAEQKAEILVLETALAGLVTAYGAVETAAQRAADNKLVKAYLKAHPDAVQVPDQGHASGGPATAGTSYSVNEAGTETLVMGGQSGLIIPNRGETGRGSVTINFNSVWPPTQQQAQSIAAIVSQQLAYEFDRASATSTRQ